MVVLGEGAGIGRETYFVLGGTRSKTVTVVGRTVPALAQIRSTLLSHVPSLVPVKNDEQIRVILDTRTNRYHSPDDPHLADIPEEYRKEYAHKWAALNDGGQPCPSFGGAAGK